MKRFLWFLPVLACAQDPAARAQAVITKNCLVCHGAAIQSSKLDLRTRESMLKGGDRGPALTPGQPESSGIYRFAAGLDQPSMPPGKKLPPEDVEAIRQWIAGGAEWTAPAAAPDPKAALAKLEERPITEEERAFWSFQPVQRPPAKSIDELWLAGLRSKGIEPNPAASRRALIRRAYLDLIGLPPTPTEVQAFLNDQSPDAFAKVVDELLASPHYGERWGRHWLDLVRYSDSAGYEFDRDRPTAFRFRDWVVRAFNEDMPYDKFLRWQIAGDEMEPGNPDAITATSFLRLGPEANIKTAQTRADELDDILATTGGALFGMTLGCARCHNHKFDPIPQKDYYRMQAVFFNAQPEDVPIVPAARVEEFRRELAAWQARQKELQAERAVIEKPYRDRLLEEKKSRLPVYLQQALRTSADQRTEGQKLNVKQIEATLKISDEELEAAVPWQVCEQIDAAKRKLAAHDAVRPRIDTVLGVVEKKFEPTYFLHHGSVDSPGSAVEPGIFSVAYRGDWKFPEGRGRRSAFADWAAAPSNPLTARVMVNRIWQHHFGEGLVRTPSNFGKTGEKPANPELLDWLASEFIRQGWSMKALHRQILLSRAYQMSSDDRPDAMAKDPENRLVWRQGRTRLESEVIRDAILAAAGTLNRSIGGPGVHPYIDPSLWAGSSGRTWPGKPIDDESTFRRSLYIFQKRTIQVPMMELFDAPNGIGSCSRRNRSTIATQALILMNNAFVLDQARRFAARLKREAGPSLEAQVRLAFELALSRPAAEKEIAESVRFIKSSATGLEDFAHAIFNLNEFAYTP
jgi:hypothetical protein